MAAMHPLLKPTPFLCLDPPSYFAVEDVETVEGVAVDVPFVVQEAAVKKSVPLSAAGKEKRK